MNIYSTENDAMIDEIVILGGLQLVCSFRAPRTESVDVLIDDSSPTPLLPTVAADAKNALMSHFGLKPASEPNEYGTR